MAKQLRITLVPNPDLRLVAEPHRVPVRGHGQGHVRGPDTWIMTRSGPPLRPGCADANAEVRWDRDVRRAARTAAGLVGLSLGAERPDVAP